MHIGILGGSFDPPHLGHLSIAQQVKAIYHLNQVWLVPCFQHPFAKQLSAATHRLAMTRLLQTDGIITSDWEATHHTMSISIETLRHFTATTGHRFSWIIGSDQLPAFPQWHEWESIIYDHGLIIVPRGPSTQDLIDQTKHHLRLTTLPPTLLIATHDQFVQSSVSSTLIRRNIRRGQPISDLVTPAVENYIIEHNLYRDEATTPDH